MEKIHVLLVEDEQTLAMIIKDTLEEQDFIITTAGDGEEGLRKFFEQKPDVLVADVMMPRMDGFEMVRRIRQSDNTGNHSDGTVYPPAVEIILDKDDLSTRFQNEFL